MRLRLTPVAGLLIATAQSLTGQVFSIPVDTLKVVVESRSRWLPDGAHPASIPWTTKHVGVDLRRSTYGRGQGSLELEWGGNLVRVSLDQRNRPGFFTVRPYFHYSVYDPPERRNVARSLVGYDRWGSPINYLPSARSWEFPIANPGGQLTIGREWVDTLDHTAAPADGLSEQMAGVWRYRVTGDSTLAGRSLPVVRFEASLTYSSEQPIEEAARLEPVRVSRSASGGMTGWFVLDTVTGLRIEGADTTQLRGEGTMAFSDGRRWTEPMSYTAVRNWRLETPERIDDREATLARQGGGMLIVRQEEDDEPTTPDQIDSLWLEYTSTEDPDERQRLGNEVWRRAELDYATFQNEAGRRLLEVGDTIPWLKSILDGANQVALTPESWPIYRGFLEDPGRTWSLGQVPRWNWNGISRTLLSAAPALNEGSTGRVCSPEFCEQIIAEMEESSEPRLRETALVARFAQDPNAAWEPLVVAYEAGAVLLEEAVQMGRGVGATWPAAPKTPVPEDGADWREWLDWMGGTIRTEDSHRMALRIYQARTRRDPLTDLELRFPSMSEDSARLVVGAVLRDHGRLSARTPTEIHADIFSGRAPLVAAAQRELDRMPGTRRVLTGPEAMEVLGPLLDSILSGGNSPWVSVTSEERQPSLSQGFHGVRDVPIYLLERSEAGDIWAGLAASRGLEATTREEWGERDPRTGGVLVDLEPVRRIGDFTLVGWNWTSWADRPADSNPVGFAGGGTFWLAHTDGRWWLISARSWIT